MSNAMHQEFANEAAKGAPPVAVAATQMAGVIDWQTWVLILTVIYLLLQIGYLIWKYIDRAHGRNKD